TNIASAVYPSVSDVFAKYLDQGRLLEAVFQDPATGQPSPLFMEWQGWLNPPVTFPGSIVGPGFNPQPFTGNESAPLEPSDAARAAIATARQEAMNISVYTVPLVIDRDAWPSFDPGWLLRDRNGIPIQSGDFVDFGYPEVPLWF